MSLSQQYVPALLEVIDMRKSERMTTGKFFAVKSWGNASVENSGWRIECFIPIHKNGWSHFIFPSKPLM